MTRPRNVLAEGDAAAWPASTLSDHRPYRAIEPIFQLVYTSTFAPGRITSARTALDTITATSRERNIAAAVSGCLIFDGQTFVHILEGPVRSVQVVFNRIRRDRRHRALVFIGSRASDRRSFTDRPLLGILQPGVFAEAGLSEDLESRKLRGETALALAERLATTGEPVS